MNFAVGPENSVINLINGQVNFFREFKLQKNCDQSCSSKNFFRLIKMTRRLVLYMLATACPNGKL